jgi:outer membrane protein TolC
MSGVDDPDEIERAAAALAAAQKSLAQEETRIRGIMASLQLRSTDPGGRTRSAVNDAARQITQARITLDDTSKRMRKAAQDLRNTRIK